MLVKKFIADNYTQALERVKQELGEDALVLSTRSIKYQRDREASAPSSRVEITAALEKEPVASGPPQMTAPKVETEWTANPSWEQIQPLLQSLLTQTDRARSVGLQPEQMDLFGCLLREGVEERFGMRLFEMANKAARGSGSKFPGREDVARLMRRMLKCEGPITIEGGGPKVVALVGPTGVGKTTTIAKLAAHFALGQNLRVALISLDSYRMGAIEQLKSYADLMEVPVEAAQGRLDFRKLVAKHQDKDLVLVDTTGKSHQDSEYVRELEVIFRSAGPVETHLVQSVTTQDAVLNESFARFAPLRPDRVLFTKLDEGVCFGTLFNCAVRHRLPFSYFTAGQNVPEDIEVAARDRVIRLIFS